MFCLPARGRPARLPAVGRSTAATGQCFRLDSASIAAPVRQLSADVLLALVWRRGRSRYQSNLGPVVVRADAENEARRSRIAPTCQSRSSCRRGRECASCGSSPPAGRCTLFGLLDRDRNWTGKTFRRRNGVGCSSKSSRAGQPSAADLPDAVSMHSSWPCWYPYKDRSGRQSGASSMVCNRACNAEPTRTISSRRGPVRIVLASIDGAKLDRCRAICWSSCRRGEHRLLAHWSDRSCRSS